MAMRQPRVPFSSATDWTVDMLDELPDDGKRREIIDGVLFVSPSPSPTHQRVMGTLYSWLRAYLLPHYVARAYVAPLDVQRHDRDRNRLQPDVLAVRLVDGRDPPFPFNLSDLLLAAEVESPSTREYDHGAKRVEYLSHGVLEYWIVNYEARTFMRLRSAGEAGDVLTDQIAWHPAGMPEPFVIDIHAFFDEALR